MLYFFCIWSCNRVSKISALQISCTDLQYKPEKTFASPGCFISFACGVVIELVKISALQISCTDFQNKTEKTFASHGCFISFACGVVIELVKISALQRSCTVLYSKIKGLASARHFVIPFLLLDVIFRLT